MKITFLYWDGCPSYELALGRLRKVLREEGISEMSLQIFQIPTEEEAIQHRFPGSPTIRINGADMDPHHGNTSYGLLCRSYLLENGRQPPLPSEEMIRRAIRQAYPHRSPHPLTR